MKLIRERLVNILMAAGEILVGILLLINPLGFTAGIIAGIGMLLTALGTLWVLGYFREEPLEAVKGQKLTKGLCAFAGGAFCIFKYEWFIATFPLLTILYGIGILLTGITKVQWAVDMLRMKVKLWYYAAISAAVTLLVAMVILMAPFTTTAVLWNFIAVGLIVEAVADILAMFFSAKRHKEAEKAE